VHPKRVSLAAPRFARVIPITRCGAELPQLPLLPSRMLEARRNHTMTDPRKRPSVARLELNKETVQDLTDSEAEAAAGGKRKPPHSLADNSCIKMLCRSKLCITVKPNCGTVKGACDPYPK